MILAWVGGEICWGQAQNGVYLDFQVKFDFEGPGRSVHKTIGTLTKVFRIFCPNLGIIVWTGLELSRGHGSDWHTQTDRQTHTHTQTQVTTLPEGQNWPRVKTVAYMYQIVPSYRFRVQVLHSLKQFCLEPMNAFLWIISWTIFTVSLYIGQSYIFLFLRGYMMMPHIKLLYKLLSIGFNRIDQVGSCNRLSKLIWLICATLGWTW